MVQRINHIHEFRKWGFEGNDPRLERLSFIENKIADFMISEEVSSEWSWLVKTIGEERLERVVHKILRCNAPNPALKDIETVKNKLCALIDFLNEKPLNLSKIKSAFQDLPLDVQNLFYWSVWVHYGSPNEEKFGEKTLTEGFALLNEITAPLIHLKGKTLCEQMRFLYESYSIVEEQKAIISQLQKILAKTSSPYETAHHLRSLLEQLPEKLQWQLHEEIYLFSSHRADEAEWGKKELSKDPKILLRLRNPHKKGTDLLDQCLQEQTEILRSLENMRDVEEFDRLTLIYKTLNPAQWRAVLGRSSLNVREWIRVVEAKAKEKAKIRSDSRHLYQWRGAHPNLNGTKFQVYAPHARQIKLVLTAFGKEEHCISMDAYRNSGVFETQTHLASPGRTYRYLIEDCHGNWKYRTDPFSFSLADSGEALESVVVDGDSFVWNDKQWMEERSRKSVFNEPLSIYELHVDSWRNQRGKPLSFRELAWEIVHYQQKVPFTHVQLYGVLDHKNIESWGYQVDHFFAPNRRLGNADDFKFFIDLCHQHEIGVIMDWIPTHYKHEHEGDHSQSLFNYDGTDLFGSHPSYWGTIFFDFSKDETKRFLLSSALYWVEKMHIDGLRIDAVSPMIEKNQWPAIKFLKDLNCLVHEQYHGILMIAEETDGFPKVTKPVYADGLGFDFKLAIHMQHRMRQFFRTPYEQRGEEEHVYGKLLNNLNEITRDEQWLIAHSHDDAASEGTHRFSTIYGSIPTTDTWRKFADMRLFHSWNLLTPGFGHGIHMGDEIGQKWPWNERLTGSEGALEWDLLHNDMDSSFHRGLQECVGDLNRFYRSRQAFWKNPLGYQLISINSSNKVIGFHRLDQEGQRLALFFNFSTMGYQEYDFPLASIHEDPHLNRITGAKEIFNTDGAQYGGTGNFKNILALIVRDSLGVPTHFRFAFPPLSLVAFEELWS